MSFLEISQVSKGYGRGANRTEVLADINLRMNEGEFVAIVGYSGMLVTPNDGPAEAIAKEVKSRPPVLLVHGDSDDLIPVQALFQAAQGLAALGVPAEWHVSTRVGHGIDAEGLRHGGEFLARAFRRGADGGRLIP